MKRPTDFGPEAQAYPASITGRTFDIPPFDLTSSLDGSGYTVLAWIRRSWVSPPLVAL